MKIPLPESLFIKVAILTLLKKNPAQVVFCKFLNSTFFVKQIQMVASEHL